MEKKTYADVWGDTVDIKHLACGMIIGITISLTCYVLGLKLLQANYPKLAANLMTAYALLIGIAGCLISAVISANLFKPKRNFSEANFSEEDRMAVLKELNINMDREAEELKLAGPEIVAEMKELQIYDVFVKKNNSRKEGE